MRIGRVETTLNYVLLAVFAVGALVPLVGVLLSAVTPEGELRVGFDLPSRISPENFASAWQEGGFSRYMVNSVLVAVGVVLLTGLLSTLAGYAFATMRFPGRTVLFYVTLLGLMLPVESFVIPLYYDLRGWGLTDTYWALLFPQTAQSLAFGTFWMRNYFLSYPASVLEAARMDGATDRAVLWRVLVPSARPALATMGLLIAMWTWNEFLLPLVMVTGETWRTAPLGLAFFQGQHTTQTQLLAAAATIVAVPIVLLYLFGQRRFIAGMLSGAVKG
ncbi:carbohydrate ABC transporter permease [Kineococcus rhizosphaerae]|uniref:Carbohydrate ABC transporter membrane protein 2 (CUT1 family) n=1 Tax=Kineococcus rhizosphaerae TaxID=559628 RepID=A0A2T0QX31_9ACTN|nr:carbohydrate ABC transporter permease [Kineococcus rhizosphaerae]PRY10263.1 carbohydrate ABC transporter membrane protein 2 (CUT1 family) [Kineococcus rhizosphaerae]